jgi:hypothetical protein
MKLLLENTTTNNEIWHVPKLSDLFNTGHYDPPIVIMKKKGVSQPHCLGEAGLDTLNSPWMVI